MSSTLSKYQAEKKLGLSGSYTYKELQAAYREAIKKNHPDIGGDPDEMTAINSAHDMLSRFFSGDKSKTVKCDDKDYSIGFNATNGAYSSSSPASYSTSAKVENTVVATPPPPPPSGTPVEGVPHPSDMPQNKTNWGDIIDRIFEAGDNAPVKKKMPDPSDYQYGTETSYRYHEMPEAEYESMAGAAMTVEAINIAIENKDSIKGFFSRVTGSCNRRPDIKGAPKWWKKKNKLASTFPWRTIIWVICFIIALYFAFSSVSVNAVSTFVLFGTIIVTFLNIFGVFTNPIRARIRKKADAKLVEWASERGLIVDFDEGVFRDSRGNIVVPKEDDK